jgi:hypothetical protein
MDIGYVIVLLLVLVYVVTAAVLYMRAKQQPTESAVAEQVPPEEPEAPEEPGTPDDRPADETGGPGPG